MEEEKPSPEQPSAEAFDDAEAPAGSRGLIPDAVRKAILAGVGALFMTEEGARRLARDWKLPKEVIGFIGQQANSAKEEVLRVLSEEIRRFLESEAVRKELGRALESMSVEVHAEIRLRRAEDGSTRPEVRATVEPGRGRRRGRRE
ncbi:MAG TPA: hypothetical protein VFG59_16485 [Anaeromyxobacter sp.]|nr:hypothetical protein [Anaeromyxobacter sp.]